MAGTTNDIEFISTTSSPFEPWLNFKQLRSNSIEYLANLTGKIWTDYNMHDPGITILEMLCYAVMDLGYRANLPVEQVLAPVPGAGAADTNFFTPAQILACNPLTILDYRRLLIDIEGVTNAWLEVATDKKDLCRTTAPMAGCLTYLNGLYHVYLQVDENISTKKQREEVVERVRTSLMAHRNFCEDFCDISILCTMGIGVCADIELVVGADPATVFQGIVAALQAFFSTEPKFYTLQELLQPPKCKPIEAIFAGRPYDNTQSYGFVDPDEFAQITLRREIHLSDLYKAITGVKGVATVRRLALQVCGNNPVAGSDKWVFHVPENYVPVFNLSCCGWQFWQNGRSVPVNAATLSAPFALGYSANAKILYPKGSPYLDLAVQYGQYLPGLGDYYSIQNEFPRVYGIGPGGLPSEAPPQRKAQALQLKGYLLFFDQLLADYVSQLANIRMLFSRQAPAAADQHTYFSNQLASVPGIDALIKAGDTETATAIAVNGKLLEAPIVAHVPKPYPFDTVDERNVAVWQFIDDGLAGSLEVETIAIGSCYYFYLKGTYCEVVLMGRVGYDKVQDAANAGNLILSSAAQKTNYSLFNLPDGEHFCFSVGMDIPGYYNYLQQLVEDQALYTERRGQFLDHLLARFAEQFADLAILSYGFKKGSALDGALITAKENFLTNYVDLSSNRGKGPDYSVNGWYNNNVSGFEKRVAALAGMNDGGNHSLCNFVVEQREDRFIIRIVIDGQLLFIAEEKLYSREATCQSACELFRCATDFGNYGVCYDEAVSRFGVKLYYQNKEAWCPPRFDLHADAMEHAHDVHALFAPMHCEEAVSLFVFRIIISDFYGTEVVVHKDVYPTEAEARGALVAAAQAHFANIHFYNDGPAGFANLDGFRFVPDDAIEGKVGVMTYRLVDDALKFRLQAAGEFDSRQHALDDYYRLIRLLGERSSLVTVYDRRMEGYQVRVIAGEELVAFTSTFYATHTEATGKADYINAYSRRHLYYLHTPERPWRWKFNFSLGFGDLGRYSFSSVAEYSSPPLALEASQVVDAWLDAGDLRGLNLEGKGDVEALLRIRRGVRQQAALTDPVAYSAFVQNETLDREHKWIYRLVDKDNLHAVYLPDDYKDDCADACKRKKGLFQQQPPYDTIDFCLGGDIIHERIDPVCGDVYYHFQLKLTRCSDPALVGLVLFESVQGYTAVADAQAAFDSLFMPILREALDPANYGVDKYISTEEVFINTTGVCVMLRSIVFIPDRTKKVIPWYHPGQLIDKLAALVKLYPMRLITDSKADRAEFRRRFPCFDLPPVVDSGCGCQTALVIHSYYFFLLCNTAGNEVWQSVWPVTSLQEARDNFGFFLLLLRYPGNYLVERDPCTCRWRIFIREVLAESTRRFTSRREAWGREGIEKFICTAQVAGAFHLYHNRKTCCDSFYVACPHPLLIHPCHYDTPESRDEALTKLFQAFKEFSTRNLPDLFFPHETNFIYDLQGEAVAVFDNLDVERDFAVYCCKLLELVDAILNGAAFGRGEEGCVIFNEQQKVIAHALDPEMCLDEWKRRLQELAWYFPIVREKAERGKQRFCIEIRLPCFNHPEDDLREDRGCGCEGSKGGPGVGCWVAWKSQCCYETCQKAFTDYFMLLAVLAERRNYRPIDDCPCEDYPCGDFRIVLHQSPDIVAFNPQCYVTPDIDCAAVKRAKRLINAEGLHSVEHILLRPKVQADCGCDALTQRCPDQTDCQFTWSPPPSYDPCVAAEEICFVPGSDPYSFIATVALPAWTERFRSKGNRAYIEYMLAREAPAHVQLRVLWLAPHDLCCFEAHYRQWLRYLACKQPCCEETYTPCKFIDFLFQTRFECLDECTECPPCKRPVDSPCFEGAGEQLHAIGEYTMLNQIDELYCWTPIECKEYQWVECEACGECACEESEAGTVASEAVVRGTVESAVYDRERRRFINARHADYKKRRDMLEKKVGENEALEKAKKFLAAKEVTADRFAKVIGHVLDEKGAWKKELAAILSSEMLDTVVLKGGKAKVEELRGVFKQLNDAKIDTETLFAKWSDGLEPHYVSSADLAGLRGIVEGKG